MLKFSEICLIGIGFLAIFNLNFCQCAKTQGCTIPIGSKALYHHQWPLVFTPQGDFYPVTKRTALNDIGDLAIEPAIVVNSNEEVLLSCGPNYFKNSFKKTTKTVYCNEATHNFTSSNRDDGIDIDLEGLRCDLRVIEEVVMPVFGCVNDEWTSTRFGYVHPTETATYIVGEACYNMNDGTTIFSHVKLNAKGLNHLETVNKNYLTSNRHPDGRYKIALFRGLVFDGIYQRFRTLTGKSPPSLKMTNYIDGQLLGNIQLQPVQKLGWNYLVTHDNLEVLQTLKEDISVLGKETDDLDVYVGGHGVYEIETVDGKKHPFYLQEASERFPIPKFIWFLVKYEERATAFIISNTDQNSIDIDAGNNLPQCKRECKEITWLEKTLQQNVNPQSMVCCDYAELRELVPEVPILPKIKNLLKTK